MSPSRASQSESASSRFLADLSHEVRSPLNAIVGFSELLSEETFGPLNAQQVEVIRDILQAGRHLQRLVDDVLDLSKIRLGRMELQWERLCVASVVEQALSMARAVAPEKGMALSSEVPAALAVWADERRVVQILCNLLTNALRYSPDASTVHVAAASAGDFTQISVRDTGCGIALEDQARIFEEFVSLPCGAQESGTGLGLSVTRRLVELMGGQISVVSAPGVGSTFSFTLPAAAPPVADEQPRAT
ncbi:MAG: HAMP domain-containing sensor histidine kinase [Armatimonadota bacterium]